MATVIGKDYTDTKVSMAEEQFCMYKLGMTGSGTTALIDAIFKLDTQNQTKIALGFPELVNVINRFCFETGYWKDLVSRWNKENNNHQLFA